MFWMMLGAGSAYGARDSNDRRDYLRRTLFMARQDRAKLR
jgi:hypothetical protein